MLLGKVYYTNKVETTYITDGYKTVVPSNVYSKYTIKAVDKNSNVITMETPFNGETVINCDFDGEDAFLSWL